jgi:chromosome segregation ATPase
MQHSADSHHNLLIADALKQLSACRRQSKACNDEVESLLSKFKRHQNEFDLLSEQLQSAQSQTPQVQAELEHAKQDAEAGKSIQGFLCSVKSEFDE